MVSRVVATSLGLSLLSPAAALATTMPVASAKISIGMEPVSPRAGAEVQLTGAAGAPTYAWDLDGDGQFDDATGKVVSATFPAGTHTVRAQASTPLGVLTDSRTFTTHEWNATPGGTVVVEPYSARVGVPVTVTAKGIDPDGLRVATALDLDADGTFETAGDTGTATFATVGERVIRARFTDDAGAVAVATTTLDVHAGNLAPEVKLGGQYFIGGAPNGGGPFFGAQAVDPDGAVVRYEFDLDGDGTFEHDNGANPTVNARPEGIVGVRVTDDGGAVAVSRRTEIPVGTIPRVVEVGRPVTLSAYSWYTNVEWDADGDGAFDDGTGNTITFTYPTAGTYEIRARLTMSGQVWTAVDTTTARPAAEIAGPRVGWGELRPVRASQPAGVGYAVAGTGDLTVSIDPEGDGTFATPPAPGSGFRATFSGPTTVALKGADSRGRTATTTAPVPFVPGNLGPDAAMRTSDIDAPLRAGSVNASIWGVPTDEGSLSSVAWDADGDGQYDVPALDASRPAPPRFGLRVTDSEGASTTVRRELAPVLGGTPKPTPDATRWLVVAMRKPHLATLLRRGLTVDVKCTKPKCKTALKVTVDAKTARKLKLRSRTVASKTVRGSRQVRVTLTPKAKRALKKVRSVKLALSATATAEAGAKRVVKKTLTVKKVAARS